jgi:hypothetical protein
VIKRRIARMDPERDHEEIARLVIEVLYGDPISHHAAYQVGFARQMAVPSIARIVYRNGRGDNVLDAARRTDDTLTFFGEFFRHGHSSPEGRAAIARMERIHSRFPISADEKRYTMASMIFDVDRLGRHIGVDPLTPVMRQAHWRFWRGIAEQMALELPESYAEYFQWTLDYERNHWSYTDAGRAVVDAMFEDWETRWFPRARCLGRQVVLALMEPEHREVLHLEAPNRAIERLVLTNSRASLTLTAIRAFRLDRSRVQYFGRRHGPWPDLERVGHQRQTVPDREAQGAHHVASPPHHP